MFRMCWGLGTLPFFDPGRKSVRQEGTFSYLPSQPSAHREQPHPSPSALAPWVLLFLDPHYLFALASLHGKCGGSHRELYRLATTRHLSSWGCPLGLFDVGDMVPWPEGWRKTSLKAVLIYLGLQPQNLWILSFHCGLQRSLS